ncbi:MAG: choice-of-anchor D domain-containing protein [Calditrichaeota bacterium]|nr:MAG: choice-of-anchor D domain-containing protein [Calditrichota bacterium]
MKFSTTLFLLLTSFTVVFGGNGKQTVDLQNVIQLSEGELDFGIVFANQTDSLSFWIKNNGTTTFNATDFLTFQSEFSLKINSLSISPGDSSLVFVYADSKHNLDFEDFLVIENSELQESLVLPIYASFHYSDVYYSSTQDLSGQSLYNALFNLVDNHNNLGYTNARKKMYTDYDNFQDSLECVYTGRKIYHDSGCDCNPSASAPTFFNAEHTWPQSQGASGTAKSDMNHLFPTDATSNSQRGSYPFGDVVSNISWNQGGSKKGDNSNGATVFEPRDVHKGDCARAMFYFALRYGNPNDYISVENQEDVLRQWHTFDPVSTKEINRNNGIEVYQNTRNPFIDHPEFMERISTLAGTPVLTFAPEIAVSPQVMDFGSVAVGDSSEWLLTIVNSGNANLSISGIQSQDAIFSVVNSVSSVSSYDFVQVKIKFKPLVVSQNYSTNLIVQSNDSDEGTITIPLSGIGDVNSSVEEKFEIPKLFYLSQNFPNPFNPTTTINYELRNTNYEKSGLVIFNVLGEEIKEFELTTNKGSVIWDGTNSFGKQVSSGIYFYTLKTSSFSETRKMLLLK